MKSAKPICHTCTNAISQSDDDVEEVEVKVVKVHGTKSTQKRVKVLVHGRCIE